MNLESISTPPNVWITTGNLLWPRRGISVQLFYDYWSGAHTQISSRLPGIYQYFEHQLDPDGGKKFPKISGVDQLIPKEEIFYGDAELSYLSEEDLKTFTSSSFKLLMEDEQNVFRKTISYQSHKNNTLTFLDLTSDKNPNDELGQNRKYMLYLRKVDNIGIPEFRDAVKNQICTLLATAPEVIKLRVRLFETYDSSKVTFLAQNVDNTEALVNQYQACIEIVFANAMGLQRFSLSSLWLEASKLFKNVVKVAHTFRDINTFTVYNNGRITLAGLRSPAIAREINEIGATNQVDIEVLQLLIEKHVGNPFE